jgi:putative ABC transport system permease protein
VIAGRWLRAGDDSGRRTVAARGAGLALGDSLKATIRGRTLAWPAVGVVKAPHPDPRRTPAAAVRAATGDADSFARGARVALAGHDDAAQRAGQAAIERALEGAGIEGAGITQLLDQRKAFADHLVIIYTALYLAAALVVLVGGIGLTSTLLLNVFERTREIGVLRAIGAAPRVIAQNVVIEGVTIGVLSWCVALVATIPAPLALDALTGKMFVNAPVDFVFSAEAAGAWLLVVARSAGVVPGGARPVHRAEALARIATRRMAVDRRNCCWSFSWQGRRLAVLGPAPDARHSHRLKNQRRQPPWSRRCAKPSAPRQAVAPFQAARQGPPMAAAVPATDHHAFCSRCS